MGETQTGSTVAPYPLQMAPLAILAAFSIHRTNSVAPLRAIASACSWVGQHHGAGPWDHIHEVL